MNINKKNYKTHEEIFKEIKKKCLIIYKKCFK